ncbi:MAG: hypothetical protein J2P15_08635 [Micromonosporaceae bacterium]|nr:hypothetical protein [Micromonosporaceae bacterium]
MEDLRDALCAAVAEPPPTRIELDRLVAECVRHRSRYRWTLAAVGSAALVAVAAVVPALLLAPGGSLLGGPAPASNATRSVRASRPPGPCSFVEVQGGGGTVACTPDPYASAPPCRIRADGTADGAELSGAGIGGFTAENAASCQATVDRLNAALRSLLGPVDPLAAARTDVYVPDTQFQPGQPPTSLYSLPRMFRAQWSVHTALGSGGMHVGVASVGSAPTHYCYGQPQCQITHRSDGLVVGVTTSTIRGVVEGLTVVVYRPGQHTVIAVSTFLPQNAVARASLPLSEAQLVAIATDPSLALG